ncbi:ribonuclease J [Candidatus Microgenomates bacterium]|nr:ribonuclease J [Candidatus Microgenomates bacterium]
MMLKIYNLGGFGRVTTNMFVYEIAPEGDILIVDCGFGFPQEEMFGVDLVIPDISVLRGKEKRIKGIVLTHGHEDHIGALPYVLPKLQGGSQIPIYGSKLTLGLASEKLKEFAVGANFREIDKQLTLGAFQITAIPITHSIPDSRHYFIRTPYGNVYHGSDFKFDWTPIDGKISDVAAIARAGDAGVDLLFSDCLRIENEGVTPSESTLDDMFDREIRHVQGRFIMTTMSSNISRVQQAIDASVRNGRKVGFVGRSFEQTTRVAQRLGYLRIPSGTLVDPRQLHKIPRQKLTLIVAGAQGQMGSSLDKIAQGLNPHIKLTSGDHVLFSTDYIPGNELAIHALIDLLTASGVSVTYAEIADDLHVSGHASHSEIALLIALTRPRALIPIGGTLRHMHRFRLLANEMKYRKEQIILPEADNAIVIDKHQVKVAGKVPVREVFVDSMGIGEVGPVILRDRKTLAQEGIVAVIAQWEAASGQLINIDMITRGFLFGKSEEAINNKLKNLIFQRLQKMKLKDVHFVREQIVAMTEPFLWEETSRRPIVIPVVVEV